MNIGDLVIDEWGEMAIIIGEIGVVDRFRIKYIATGGVSAAWGSNLYPLG